MYAFKEPVAAHAIARRTRTFPKHSRRGEKSEDGKTWGEFMVVEVYRSGVAALPEFYHRLLARSGSILT
jgi:hypothetical protein